MVTLHCTNGALPQTNTGESNPLTAPAVLVTQTVKPLIAHPWFVEIVMMLVRDLITVNDHVCKSHVTISATIITCIIDTTIRAHRIAVAINHY